MNIYNLLFSLIKYNKKFNGEIINNNTIIIVIFPKKL